MAHKQASQAGVFSDECAFEIIESYFRGKHLKQLTRHQIESMNDFYEHQAPKTVGMFNPVCIASEQDLDRDSGKYSLSIEVRFENLHMYRAQIHENNGATKLMFPQEARVRNFTYSSTVTVDVHVKYIVRQGDDLQEEHVFHKVLPKIHIGRLPIMLNSSVCILSHYQHADHNTTGECQFDAGGYFIINGSEKTILCQERAAENRIQCFNVQKNSTKWSWQAEIKSIPDNKCISPKQITMTVSCKNNGFGFGLYVQLPRMRQPIPLFVLFRALGVLSDKEICDFVTLSIGGDREEGILSALRGSVIDANEVMTQDLAIKFMMAHVMYTPINMEKEQGMRRKREFTLDILESDLFPHCGGGVKRIYFLGLMANRLLQASLGWIKEDERDSYINKRIDTPGILLNNLFRNYFNKLVKDMQKQIVREINTGSWRSSDDYVGIINNTNIYKIIKSTTIENGIKRALATGDFGIKHNNSNKVGVAQVLNRLTYISGLSHLRRLNTPIDKSGKLIPPRKLHNSSFGFVCPPETPEGHSVGVVKNLSVLAHVTIPSNSGPIHEYVKPFLQPITEGMCGADLVDMVKVFVNGAWIGVTSSPLDLFSDLKRKKALGIINIYTSIVFKVLSMQIHVCNDAGRLCRPVLKVRDNKLLFTPELVRKIRSGEMDWNSLLISGPEHEAVIEYIDPDEQAHSLIAMSYRDLSAPQGTNVLRYTHCEIHPSTIFGVLASCIPFPEHNQSPRNTYQCAMGKQAMGVYVTNFDSRMDKTAYVLSYPARPLVDTRVMNMLQLNRIPSGCPVMVAIMTYSGYNQEDSIMVNQGAIDRGLFMATIFHTEKDEDKKIHGDEEIRCKPDPSKTRCVKFGNYDKLNSKGVIPENTLVENRDIIMSKVVPIKEYRNDPTKVVKYEDQSRSIRVAEETYVDRNVLDRNGDGYNFAKIRLRAVRKPVIGDKFSSRHGQKGTVGNIIPEHDMPFLADGTRPDIIINPHAIPSRMTIAQLKETLLGKALLTLGLFGDGTSFGTLDIDTIRDQLVKLGYESTGNELLHDGLTGEQLETSVFYGPVFYQRLKHMVSDKQHSRATGPNTSLTRQPAEGRARDGGLRFGEMERDCMVSHGAARFTKGRLYDASDKFEVHVCKKCGMVAAYNDEVHIHYCKTCENRTDFARVQIPYACKLLWQELQTMNVMPRVITE